MRDDCLTLLSTIGDHRFPPSKITSVQAVIRHLAPCAGYPKEKPYLSRLPYIEGFKRTNIIDKDYTVTLQNVMGKGKEFCLDSAGFEYQVLPFATEMWNDEAVIKTYIPCVEKWLANLFSSNDVIVYAFNVS